MRIDVTRRFSHFRDGHPVFADQYNWGSKTAGSLRGLLGAAKAQGVPLSAAVVVHRDGQETCRPLRDWLEPGEVG